MKYTIGYFTSKANDNIWSELEPSDSETVEPSESQFVRGLKKAISGDEHLEDSIYVFRMKSEWRNLLICFFKQWSRLLPQINEVIKFISHIDDGKYLGVSLNTKLELLEEVRLLFYMQEREQNISTKRLYLEFKHQYGALLKIYKPFTYSINERIRFGEYNRKQRVCRYCGKDFTETTFKNDSHTISNCLGNVNYFTRDECDECNRFFGATIEQEFLNYISIYRTLSSLHTGFPSFTTKTKKFALGVDELTKKIDYKVLDENGFKIIESDKQIVLRHDGGFINFHWVYRALVKFVIGMLPNEELKYFKDTIKWVNGEKDYSSLPMVKKTIFKDPVQHPYINMYFRKNNSNKYPYLIAEFHVNHLEFVYAIPGCQRDNFEVKNNIIDDFLKLIKNDSKWRSLVMNRPQPVHMNFDAIFYKNTDEHNMTTDGRDSV